MRYQVTIDIDAPIEQVWETLVDVARWSEWTSTVTRTEMLDDGPFGVGTRARVMQPRLRPAIWRVTEVKPGRSFAWVSRSPGVNIWADHVVTARPGGGTTVTQTLEQTGPLEPLIRPFLSGMVRRYLRTEVEGLKRHCEASRRGVPHPGRR